MNRLPGLVNATTATLDRAGDGLLPALARAVFATVLPGYFRSSALTTFDGLFTPSGSPFSQIYPRAFEAAGYDPGRFGLIPRLVVLFGDWAEFVLPLLIVLGLLTRVAALGRIGFTVVQSLTDKIGHKAAAATIRSWFNRASDAVILDQRALWVVVLVCKGAGPVS